MEPFDVGCQAMSAIVIGRDRLGVGRGAVAVAALDHADRLPLGHGGEPGTDAIGRVDAVDRAQQCRERGLGDVGRVVGGETEVEGNRVDEALVAFDQLVPRPLIAAPAPGQQRLVVHGGELYRYFVEHPAIATSRGVAAHLASRGGVKGRLALSQPAHEVKPEVQFIKRTAADAHAQHSAIHHRGRYLHRGARWMR
ncbi:MAG: hypothetical protein FD127_1482 [Acidimicrobiaceae bacterium]|nr:MAG: hypothetical protein FD127_1482 [Acidimicrobiaceae bacterium]